MPGTVSLKHGQPMRWMKEAQARRALAEARLKKPAARRRMTHEEITSLVTELGGIMQALKEADPAEA
jgi:hypothetical protein